MFFARLCIGAPVDDRVGVEVQTRRASGKTGLRCPHGARVVAVTQRGFQAAAVGPAVRVRQGQHIGLVVLEVAVQAIPVFVGGRGRGAAFKPGKPPVGLVVVVQVVIAGLELVGRANAQAVVQRQPASMGGRAGIVAASVAIGRHGIDAQGRVVIQLEIEVALITLVIIGAKGRVDLLLGDQSRLLADLVHDAAGGAPAKQHGRRAAQHFHPIGVEHVTVVLRNVAHAIEVNIARRAEAAQADVVADAAALTGLEGDADDVFERALEAVLALVMNQLVVDHRQRLRNVLGGHRHFPDAGDAALVGLGCAVARSGHGDGCQGFAFDLRSSGRARIRRGCGALRPAGNRSCQHQRTQRQQDAVRRRG